MNKEQIELILKDRGIESLVACSKDFDLKDLVHAYKALIVDLKKRKTTKPKGG